tara:strand:+ start:1411 stop:2112 length:702 start_codon:yes stop_codon:yes gene_type:complete
MVKNHLSRLNAPKSWPIRRKGIKFIAKPSPGPYRMRECIGLGLAVKELLRLARTTKEIKSVLNEKNILVNGVVRKDHKFPLGIMDVVEVPQLGKNFMLLYNRKGKFMFQELKKGKENTKLSKIIEKTSVKGNKTQLNMSDGTNILLAKNDYSVGDTLVIDLKAKKVASCAKLEKGAKVYVTGGKKVGMVGVINEIKKLEGKRGFNVIMDVNGKKVETAKDYVFAIGDVEIKNE